MRIDCKVKGLDELKKMLSIKSGQIPFATSLALNRTAAVVSDSMKSEMRAAFDRPTPWVIGGVRYRKSTKYDLRASIDLDYWGNKQSVAVEQVLNAEIFGGSRKNKRHEVALSIAGVLPPGMQIIPGRAAVLDTYGNMGSGQISQIISYFKAYGQQGYQANMSDKRKSALAKDKKKSGLKGFVYFVLKKAHGKLLPGIYQRITFGHGTAVKPVMIFVRKTGYKKRFDFYGIAEKEVNRVFPSEFFTAIEYALRTAR